VVQQLMEVGGVGRIGGCGRSWLSVCGCPKCCSLMLMLMIDGLDLMAYIIDQMNLYIVTQLINI